MLNEKVEKFTSKTEHHENMLAKREVDIELLKAKNQSSTGLTILMGVVTVSSFALSLLNQLRGKLVHKNPHEHVRTCQNMSERGKCV